MRVKVKKVSKVDKILKDKDNLKKVAKQCNFLTNLDNDENQAFETLFKQLDIQKSIRTKHHKRKIKTKIKSILCKNDTIFKNVSCQIHKLIKLRILSCLM